MRRTVLRSVLAVLAVAALASAGGAQEEGEPEGWRSRERVDGTIGAFTENIPIEVPAFRGLEPPLALTYDSGRGDGIVGVGWKLDGLSAIERARPHGGTPLFDDASDVFVLDGEELVACTAVTAPASVASCASGGTHATRIESYLRIKRDTAANKWEVTNRDGTKLTYQRVALWGGGTTAVATNLRWLLASVADTHANTVQYSYVCDTVPNCYIDTIAYNGNTVRFYRESRTDPIWYATGAGLGKVTQRIKTIEILVGGQRARAYKLTYEYGSSTGRSRLTSVQQFGKDATLDGTKTVTGGTSLPPVTLSYSNAPNTVSYTPWAVRQGAYEGSAGRLIGDFNGDGRSDFFFKEMTGTCQFEVRVSNGSSFDSQQWTVTPAAGVSCNPYPYPASAADPQPVWISDDYNGDGKSDVMVYCCKPAGVGSGGGGGFTPYVFLSSGAGFSVSKWADTVTIAGQSGFEGTAGDFNGDGMADFFISSMQAVIPPPNPNGEPTYPDCKGRVAISTGSAFETSSVGIPSCKFQAPSNPNIVHRFFRGSTSGDVNGDGKADLLFERVTGRFSRENEFINTGTAVRVFLGNANGTFTPDGIWISAGLNQPLPQVAGDLNGDGRDDAVKMASGNITAYLSTGAAFQAQAVSTRPTGACSNCNLHLDDFDGDGMTDVITTRAGPTTANYIDQITVFAWGNGKLVGQSWGMGWLTDLYPMYALELDGDGKTDLLTTWNDGGQWSATVNRPNAGPNGPIPDLLVGVTGSLGATTTVAYAPSSQWTNTNLPFITQTVTSIKTNDGLGTESEGTYTYAGGLWNAPERRFLGFATVTATLPKNADEANAPTITTNFLQNVCAYPKPLVTEEKDGAGTVLRKTVEEYTACDPGAMPYTSLNTATTTTIYNGGAGKSAKVTRKFDLMDADPGNNHGNILELTRHGDLARTGDEITTVTDFYPNTAAYIVSVWRRPRGSSLT